MNKLYAVVEDGRVTNIVLWDGETEWTPSSGYAVQCDEGAGIGWLYADGKFTAPVIAKSADEIANENLAMAKSEYERASVKITALNEQISDDDWGGSTENIVRGNLALWVAYRKSLRAYINAADGTQKLPVMP